MPAAKADLSTFHGRLAYARMQAGYEQAEFAKLLEMSPSGWQKIEQGQREISVERLAEVNVHLGNLDFNYYFGFVPYEWARKNPATNRSDEMVARLARIEDALRYQPTDDPEVNKLAERIKINQPLREHVARIAWQPGDFIEKVDSYTRFLTTEHEEGRESEQRHA